MNGKNLRAHEIGVHENSNICHSCGKEFTSKHGLKEHIAYEHEGKSRDKLKCSVCDATFGSR